MSEPTLFDVTEAMIDHGGSFVRTLGELFRKADDINVVKLKAAFPEYWTRYSLLATRAPQRSDR